MRRIRDFVARNRLLIVVTVLSVFALGWMAFTNRQLERDLHRLGAAYEANVGKLLEADAEILQWQERSVAQLAQLAELQRKNDVKIKEAGRNAYKTTVALSGDQLLDHFDLWIDGARSRNAERGREF